MSVWLGSAFSKAEVGKIKFIPLLSMTTQDWDWLDYDNIRDVAKDRIAKAAVEDTLVGFFEVNLLLKTKEKYLWPATPGLVLAFNNDDHSFFTHQAEVEETSETKSDFEDLRLDISLLSISDIAVLLRGTGIGERYLNTLNRQHINLLATMVLLWTYTPEEIQSKIQDVVIDNLIGLAA